MILIIIHSCTHFHDSSLYRNIMLHPDDTHAFAFRSHRPNLISGHGGANTVPSCHFAAKLALGFWSRGYTQTDRENSRYAVVSLRSITHKSPSEVWARRRLFLLASPPLNGRRASSSCLAVAGLQGGGGWKISIPFRCPGHPGLVSSLLSPLLMARKWFHSESMPILPCTFSLLGEISHKPK